MSLPITKMLYDHRALTTGVRDWPLLKSVVVTSFCFSNAVNTMSCYCKHSEFLKNHNQTKQRIILMMTLATTS